MLDHRLHHLSSVFATVSCCRSAADGIIGNHLHLIVPLEGMKCLPARGRPPAGLATRSRAIAAASAAK